MRAVAAKSSANDTAARNSQVKNHKHNPVKRSVGAFSGSITLIQRKALCPCDGGCPSCSGVIQPKLKIGQPNDKYEQEADRVAEMVMRMPEPGYTECFEEENEILYPETNAYQVSFLVHPYVDSNVRYIYRELLVSRLGQVTCLQPDPDKQHEIRINIWDEDCTCPATQEHEEAHVKDVLDCCRRWRAAALPVFTARAIDRNAALESYNEWLDWLDDNEDYLELQAGLKELTMLRHLLQVHNCTHLTSSNRTCCNLINSSIIERTQSQQHHQRLMHPLSPCPWPATSVSGPAVILQEGSCQGI